MIARLLHAVVIVAVIATLVVGLTLASIPTYVITHRLPAFLGCAAALAKHAR